jgi:hypothetical protein
MKATIRIPDGVDDRPIDEKAIYEVPRMLIDGDDRRILRELLFSARVWASELKTIGGLIAGLESLSPQEFAWGVDQLRERCGLKAIHTLETEERLEQARYERTVRPVGRLVLTANGYVDVDELERDALRERAAVESLERRRAAERIERQAEAAARDERQRTREARLDALLPAQFRS